MESAVRTKQAAPQITDSALRLPADFPALPADALERFPSLGTWMNDVSRFWKQNVNAVDDFARAVLDVTEIGGLFVVDGANQSVYVKGTRDRGAYRDPDTPVYFDKAGHFSLKQALYWEPATNTLTIEGTIIATAGEIGGFHIGTNYIRDAADSFGLSSDSTGAPPWIRFWAGSTFAARATAPFRVYSDGAVVATNATITGSITATSGAIGGFTIGADYIRDAADSFGLASTATGADDVRFWAGSTFAARATAPFRITESGAVVATNATISGSITATAGSIGGFTIGADYIRDAGDSFGLASTVTGGDDTRFWAGAAFASRATAPFRVTEAGAVVATNATISGSITATTGSIGGWVIGATTLSGTNAVLSSAGSLVLGTANDVVIVDANDATYRLWIGNATAGSASFRVTKAGLMTATAAVIGGTGTAGNYVSITSAGLQVGDNTASGVIYINNNAGIPYINLRYNGNVYGTWSVSSTKSVMQLSDNGGNAVTIDGIGQVTIFGAPGGFGLSVDNSATIGEDLYVTGATLAFGQIQAADGSLGAPAYSFSSDLDTGWRWSASGDMRGVTNGADRLVVRDGAIVCLVPLKLANNFVAVVPAATGTVTVEDGTGTTYRLLAAV